MTRKLKKETLPKLFGYYYGTQRVAIILGRNSLSVSRFAQLLGDTMMFVRSEVLNIYEYN